ncbi:MAG: hypothetical protein M1814_002881 [Vezdaea aestivalis]|nr:MAG: hypothetical protein M1814_002881 [Vezdaea aestivalis]
MSFEQSSAPEAGPNRGPSPSLNPNLPSNNPFRNRAASPASQSPLSPSFNNRPLSRNPFLDVFDDPNTQVAERPKSAGMETSSTNAGAGLDESSAAVFDKLDISDKPVSNGPRVGSPNKKFLGPGPGRHPRPENVPPPQYSGQGPRTRPPRPDPEGKLRQGSVPGPSRPRPGPAGSDREKERRRLRRNSDSSIRSSSNGLLVPEDRRRRERKDRQRRDEKAGTTKPKRQNRQLDIIDKLDVTSIYGAGLFHHDGPFDACNPHRNRRRDHRAPMQAFPKDSANNLIGGSGPVNKVFDSSQFMGQSKDGEAFTDYSRSGERQNGRNLPTGRPSYERERTSAAAAFNSTARVDPVHGDETLGLGTSTFLEGAPASRTAIQRRESESDVRPGTAGGGLQRKKSLAQKIRGIGSGRPALNAGNRMVSPEPRASDIGNAVTGGPKAQSAGGQARLSQKDRGNPFFNEYDQAYDRKGASIAEAEQRTKVVAGAEVPQEDKIDVVRRARAPSSPKTRLGFGPILERRVTSGDTPTEDSAFKPASSSGGFLSRVKSLKGGKRTRPQAEKVEA